MRTSNLAGALLVSVALLGSGCSFEPPVLSPDAHITCSSNDECPQGTSCRTQVGRCLPKGADDVAPVVVAGSVGISPSTVRAGAVMVATFELDEDCLEPPEVRIGARPFTLDARDGRRWTFSYRATGAEPEGVAPVLVTAIDLFGNVAGDVALGTTTLDFTPPEFADISIDGASVVTEGGSLVVQVAVAEDLPQAPVVTLAGRTLEVISSAAGQHRFEYVARGDEPEGTAAVSVTMADTAGNATQRTVEELVTFDFTAPTPVPDSFRLLANPVRSGASAALAFVATEPPVGTPELFLRDGDREVAWGDVNVLGFDVTASHAFEGLASGAYQILVRGLRDAAGNDAGEQVLGVLDVDTQAPVINAVTTSHSHARSGDRLVVLFEVNEALASEPEVTLGEQRAVLDASDGSSFEFGFEVDEGTYPEGVVPIVIVATDLAGNVASAMATVQLDYTAPSLLSGGARPSRAPLGAELVVSVAPTEPLSAVPTLSVQGPSELVFTPIVDSAYSWRREVTAADADGAYTATVTMSDLAGNTSTVSLPAFEIDVRAPVVSGLETNSSTFSRAADFRSVAVTFDASESFEGDGGLLIVSLGGRPMSCDPYNETSPNYTCRHTVDADDREGANIVLVAARDGAGNSTTESMSVVFDFTAPVVSSGSVAYVADVSSPLGSVAHATVGTRIIVTTVANEALAPTPAPTLTLSDGANLLVEDLSAARVDPGSATFELVVPAGAPDGQWQPTITWRDTQGNESTSATFASPTVRTVTSRPTLVVDQDAVSFLRSRWGNRAQESFGPWALPPGSVFALAPSDALASDPVLPATAFAFAMGRPLQRIRIWTDALKETLMGVAEPNADGTWPRTNLARVDTPSLWVTGIDAAGNESQVVGIEYSEWVATANPTATGASPHRLEAITVVEPTLAQSRSSKVEAAGTGLDGEGVAAKAEAAWRSIHATPVLPPQRTGFLTGYDAARGRLVRVGGLDAFGDEAFDDVWEWDGVEWHEVQPDHHPPPRARGVMAYDAARGRLVLFGGTSYDSKTNTTVVRNDLWEWDGVDWEERTPAGDLPDARFGAAMAYDSARSRLVLFGGDRDTGVNPVLGDTWAWDGTAWTKLAGPGPGATSGTAMAYDSARDRMVLLRGNDTWELNGDVWSKVTDASLPTARGGAALAFDPVSERVVLFGGDPWFGSIMNETWAFDGTTWEQLMPAGGLPSPRYNASLIFDAKERRLVLQGGDTTSGSGYHLTSELWSWDGVRWEDRAASGEPGPSWLRSTAVAYDSARERLVAFGTRSRELGPEATDELWEWSPAGWKQIPVASPWPGARYGAALAYDPQRERVVLFGGMQSAYDFYSDTWEWDGESWTQHDTTDSLAPRALHGMAWHAGLGQVVMVGGFLRGGGGVPAGEVGPWAWDGTSWTNLTPAGNAFQSATDAVIAYDRRRDRLVMFADVSGSTHKTWEWDGTSWTGFSPSVRPDWRMESALFYDPDRDRTVLYGGQVYEGLGHGPARGFHDVWEWDGASWTKIEQGADVLEQVDAILTVGPGGRKFLVGGRAYNGGTRNILYEWLNQPPAAPAFQLTTLARDAGFTASQVVGVRVRAHCGGLYSPFGASDVGATLWGWAVGGSGREGGGWAQLASNSTGVRASSPWIAAPPQAAIEWTASSPQEARRFVLERDRLSSFQCRPSGSNGLGTAAVALDYLEVRVRYRSP